MISWAGVSGRSRVREIVSLLQSVLSGWICHAFKFDGRNTNLPPTNLRSQKTFHEGCFVQHAHSRSYRFRLCNWGPLPFAGVKAALAARVEASSTMNVTDAEAEQSDQPGEKSNRHRWFWNGGNSHSCCLSSYCSVVRHVAWANQDVGGFHCEYPIIRWQIDRTSKSTEDKKKTPSWRVCHNTAYR